MKAILALILILLNLINIPLTHLYLKVQKWYLPQRKKDKVMFIAFAPFYWILVALAFIIGWPVEQLAKLVH